jgi:DnaJ-class molecular chaperone
MQVGYIYKDGKTYWQCANGTVYRADCTWCNGQGYIEEYNERIECNQCDGTGHADRKE